MHLAIAMGVKTPVVVQLATTLICLVHLSGPGESYIGDQAQFLPELRRIMPLSDHVEGL